MYIVNFICFFYRRNIKIAFYEYSIVEIYVYRQTKLIAPLEK